jgi:hypothetical protein
MFVTRMAQDAFAVLVPAAAVARRPGARGHVCNRRPRPSAEVRHSCAGGGTQIIGAIRRR